MANKREDLSVTALYTSQVWRWGRLRRAELFDLPEARVVFRVVNAALLVAKLFMWRLRSLKHSLLHRHAMIDALLERSDATRVVELAAGLSRRGAAASEDPEVRYTEVDLPHVAARKRELLERTGEGRAVAERPNWDFVAADVAELDLEPLMGPGPTFVIAEGLCMYLNPGEQRALWGRIATALASTGGTFVFDLVPWVEQPKPGPFGRALEWVMRRFTGGKSFERDLRTRDDIAADLRAAGFSEVEVLEPAEVAAQWSLPHPDKPTQQVLFVSRR